MAKRKKRGIRKAAYAHVARPLVYTAVDYLSSSSAEDKKLFDPAKAAKPLLEARNFKKIQKVFNSFVKKYNQSEENSLSEKYHAVTFLAAFTNKKSDLKILKNAQYQFLVYCCEDITQQPHNQQGKGLADIFAKSIACALSIDDKKNSHKITGSFEREMVDFITTIAKMVTDFEKSSQQPSDSNSFIERINQAEIQLPKKEQKTLARFIVGVLYNAYLSIISVFSRIAKGEVKQATSLGSKKSKFDQKDFIQNHRQHLPDMVFLMNHIFSQKTADDKDAQEFLYGLFKMSFLKKNISLRDKIFGKWSDTLLKHLKLESLSEVVSLDEKEDIVRRNNARQHLLDIALHNLFPEMADSDYTLFKKDFQEVIQKMGDKFDLAKVTPAMIDILRKPENQSNVLPLIESGVSKVLHYNPEQISQDFIRNGKMSGNKKLSEEKDSHFVSEFVSYLLQSPMTSAHIAQILKSIPNRSKDPTNMIIGLLVSKGTLYPQEYGYNDELISHMILNKPATFLRLITKVTLQALRKGRSNEEQLMSHFCKAFEGHTEKLSLLITGIADLAVARDTKNPELTKKGVEKILQTLPLLNEHVFQGLPPNQLVKSLAAMVLTKPHNPKKRKIEEIEDLQVAFFKNVVSDISNSTAQDKNNWVESFTDIIGLLGNKTTLFQKIFTIAQGHNMTAGGKSFAGFQRAYSELTEEQKQIMAECYPQLSNFLKGMSYAIPIINMTLKVAEQGYTLAVNTFGVASSIINSCINLFREPEFHHKKPSEFNKDTDMTQPKSYVEPVKTEEKNSAPDITALEQPSQEKRTRKGQP